DLGEVQMERPRGDVTNDGAAAAYELPFDDGRFDVDVLEFDSGRAHGDNRRAQDVNATVGDRIDGRPTVRGDVDAVVEAEETWAAEAQRRLVEEDRSWVAEVAADRVRPVERLQRPRIRSSGRSERRRRDQGPDQVPHAAIRVPRG